MNNIVSIKKEDDRPPFEPPAEVISAFERGLNARLTSAIIIGRDVNGMYRVFCSHDTNQSLALAARGQQRLAEHPFDRTTDL